MAADISITNKRIGVLETNKREKLYTNILIITDEINGL